ncbi:MAG: CHAD domain-containing protein [Peptococcaceae bacterium]|nr:CHAD domain-containing protein [Peptococcaceae bacterium]
MEELRESGALLGNIAERVIRNNDKNIKMYGLRQFCRQFGIDYERQAKDTWLLEFLFSGLSDIHELKPELFKVVEAAFILRDAHQGAWDDSGNCFLWDLVITHPLKRLSFEDNAILAEVLFKQGTARKQAELTEPPTKLSSSVQDPEQHHVITTIAAFLQLACYILELAPKSVKIVKLKALQLFLQVKKPLDRNNPCRTNTPLWQKQFGRVTIEWEYAASEPESGVKPESNVRLQSNVKAEKIAVKRSESSAAPAPPPFFRNYFREHVNKQMIKLLDISGRLDAMGEECIHDTRVVFRGLLSRMDSFEGYLDSKWKASMSKRIKSAFKLLGDVRDADVILLHLKEYAETNQVPAQDIAVFTGFITGMRETALSDALGYIQSPAYQSILEELSGDIRATACLPVLDKKRNALPFRLDEIMPVTVGAASLSLFAYDEWLGGCYVSEDLLHRMRVSFKRLRYLLDFFSGPFEKDVKKAIQICKQCQEFLGVMQDNCKAVEWAARFLETLSQEEQDTEQDTGTKQDTNTEPNTEPDTEPDTEKDTKPDTATSEGVKKYIAWCNHKVIECAGRFLEYWSDTGRRELSSQIRGIS